MNFLFPTPATLFQPPSSIGFEDECLFPLLRCLLFRPPTTRDATDKSVRFDFVVGVRNIDIIVRCIPPSR